MKPQSDHLRSKVVHAAQEKVHIDFYQGTKTNLDSIKKVLERLQRTKKELAQQTSQMQKQNESMINPMMREIHKELIRVIESVNQNVICKILGVFDNTRTEMESLLHESENLIMNNQKCLKEAISYHTFYKQKLQENRKSILEAGKEVTELSKEEYILMKEHELRGQTTPRSKINKYKTMKECAQVKLHYLQRLEQMHLSDVENENQKLQKSYDTCTSLIKRQLKIYEGKMVDIVSDFIESIQTIISPQKAESPLQSNQKVPPNIKQNINSNTIPSKYEFKNPEDNNSNFKILLNGVQIQQAAQQKQTSINQKKSKNRSEQ